MVFPCCLLLSAATVLLFKPPGETAGKFWDAQGFGGFVLMAPIYCVVAEKLGFFIGADGGS